MNKSEACPRGPIGSDNVINLEPRKKEELDGYMATLTIGDNKEKNRGQLIQCLHKAQELFGYLPESVQLFVADKLKLHLSEVYGVISFYSYFTTTPVGRYQINVCMGTACFVRGADRIMDEFKRHLLIDDGETSQNGKFSLGGLRCVGACSLAPIVMVNEKVYGHVEPAKVLDIINDCE